MLVEHGVGKLVVEIAWLLGSVVVGFCTRKETVVTTLEHPGQRASVEELGSDV